MGFWLFLLFAVLLLPLCMLGFARSLQNGFPADPSPKKAEQREAVYKRCGKLCFRWGLLLLPCSLLSMLLMLGQSPHRMAFAAGFLFLLQTIPLAAILLAAQKSLPCTEEYEQ